MKKLKERLLVALRWSVYPLFYLLCLVAFFYATFPWDRVKDRIIAEFDATQASKGSEAQRLEIGSLTGYWFTGVAIENAKLIIPPTSAEIAAADLAAKRAADGEGEDDAGATPSRAGGDDAEGDAKDGDAEDGDDKDGAKPKTKKAKAPTGPRDTVLLIERATARVELWPLITGRVQVSFHVEAFGGEIDGSVPVQGKGDIDLALENVDLGQIGIIKTYLTMPLRGIATGELSLQRGEGGKLSKSTGALTLVIDDAVIGDGKSKVANMITMPPAKLGKVEIAAEAEAGQLKLSKFGAAGGDLELSAEGLIKVKDKWKSSGLDLFLRFKFADEYRNRDDKTKMIFGEPGSKIPGLIDSQPKIKRAKRGDDSYGIHLYGSLKAPKYEPWTSDEATVGAGRKKSSAGAADAKDDEAGDDEATADPTDTPFRRNRSRDRTTTPPPRNTVPRLPAPVPAPGREEADDRRARPSPAPEPVIEAPLVEEPPAPEGPPEGGPVDEAPPLEEGPPGDAPPAEEVPAP